MHLNRALVSSLLFVSAVLAERLGNFAGVVAFLSYSTESLITGASGTFTVPNLWGAIGSSVVIGVGLDGLECTTASFAAGIQIKKEIDGFYYAGAWGEFLPHTRVWQRGEPEPILISFRDRIAVTVQHVGTSFRLARFTIKNLNTGNNWSCDLGSNLENPLCGDSAYWTVGLVSDGGLTPLAGFGDVVFTDLKYILGNKGHRPKKWSSFEPHNIIQGDVEGTSVEVQESSTSSLSARVIVKIGAQG